MQGQNERGRTKALSYLHWAELNWLLKLKPETDTQSVHIASSPSKEQTKQIRDPSHSAISYLVT